MLSVAYDPVLVVASILVAIMASFTGLHLTAGIGALDPAARRGAIAKAAVALGSGIWSMHFIGMLAVELPTVIVYDALPTLISVLLAILVVGLGLILLHFGVRTRLRIAAAGLLTGLGIAGMHYVGMTAVRGNCVISYAPGGILLAIAIAIAASILALELAYRRRTFGLTMLGSVILGLAIASMHYAAMAATVFSLGAGTAVVATPSLSQNELAMIVALAAFVICGLFLLMTVPIGIAGGDFATAPGGGLPASGSGNHPAPAQAASTSGRASADAALSKAFAAPAERPGPRIPYLEDDTIRFLAPGDIYAVRAQGHYTQIINGKGALFCPWPISKVEKVLDALPFIRTHRSFLVNLDHVAGFRREGDKGYCVFGQSGAEPVPVSRSQVPAVQKALGLL
jgi:NO-binding membrane sensor protein with MHYT domain